MDRLQITDAYKFREIDGTLCTAGQPSEAQLRSAAANRFEVVINLALHDDPRYSLKDEPGLVRSLGMEYVHIPVPFEAPQEADLLAFFDAMDAHKAHKILVHCAANIRVSAFLGLYRVLRQGWDEKPAFELMRSLWEPDAVWASFIAAMLKKHGGSTPDKKPSSFPRRRESRGREAAQPERMPDGTGFPPARESFRLKE